MEGGERVRERFEDAVLLALKMIKRPQSGNAGKSLEAEKGREKILHRASKGLLSV